FSSGIWLMEYGSMRLVLKVTGTRGPAQMSIPIASFGQSVLSMPLALGALLLVLVIGLGFGAISIVGAAARESRMAPGPPLTAENRRRGWRAMGIMAAVMALVFWGAFSWWTADARAYATRATFFRSPKCSAVLDGNRLSVRPSDPTWQQWESVDNL